MDSNKEFLLGSFVNVIQPFHYERGLCREDLYSSCMMVRSSFDNGVYNPVLLLEMPMRSRSTISSVIFTMAPAVSRIGTRSIFRKPTSINTILSILQAGNNMLAPLSMAICPAFSITLIIPSGLLKPATISNKVILKAGEGISRACKSYCFALSLSLFAELSLFASSANLSARRQARWKQLSERKVTEC